MPTAEYARARTPTEELLVTPGGTLRLLRAIPEVRLVVPENRERDAKAGAFDTPATQTDPRDYEQLSQQYRLQP